MFGVDYAFNPHPSISALRGAKANFVVRYISDNPTNDHNGKNLLPAEAKTLRVAGINIVVIVEYYAKRMLEGQARGRDDAMHADSVVKALGMAGMPIFFAADWDATPADQTGINAYLDGAAGALGKARVGVYGSYYVVKRALDAGKASYGWQTYAWSGGNWDDRAVLRQYRNGVSLGGASVDFDTSEKPDFGQWPRPKPVTKPVSPPVVPPVTKPVPVEPSGPFRHESDGSLSLKDFAKSRHTTVDNIIEVSFAHMDSANKLKFAEYLAGPGVAKRMPAGLVYWTINP